MVKQSEEHSLLHHAEGENSKLRSAPLFPNTTSDQERLRIHEGIGKYSVGILEQKYMVCVDYSIRTKQPCPRCRVLVEYLRNSTRAAVSEVQGIRNSLRDFDATITPAERILWSMTSTTRGRK